MPAQASITSSESFQTRFLRAERWRLTLLAASLAALALFWTIRRQFGGIVASTDSVYFPVVSILAAGILAYALGFIDTTRRITGGLRYSHTLANFSAAVDLAVPLGCLFVAQLHSPRGAYAALSGPTMLLLPIVVMLSVLRLRPLASLLTGLAAAAGHSALAYRAILVANLTRDTWPTIFCYGLMLALTGAAAAKLARILRSYLREAIDEAAAAERSGLALQHMEHELDIARTIQSGLLPAKPPAITGYDIAGMARPATQAGGDYYDWQPLSDGRVVVAIADVTGHGVGPALVMAVCRAYARATAPTAASAAALLERINDLICDDIKGQRFITMAVALVGPSGDIELLSAGHGPTFLYRAATKEVQQFGGNGLPLGIANAEQFDPTEYLRLASGDTLVLLTDGFMEQTGPAGRMFGVPRLAETIAAHATRSSADLIQALDQAVMQHAAQVPQADDMTAVVIRRL